MKICAFQLNFTIGDLQGNFNKIAAAISKNSSKSDVLVFSEMAISGYPTGDLLLRKGFVDKQLRYLERVCELTEGSDNIILLGAVTKNKTGIGKPLYNTAIAFQNGKEIYRYNKQLLPTYNIFDEGRYFEAGRSDQNQIVRAFIDNQEVKFGVLICEDAWDDSTIVKNPLYHTNPMKDVGDSDVELIITINASPSHIGKNEERYRMYEKLAKHYNKSILYVNQVGANDCLIFDGYSFFVQSPPMGTDRVSAFPMKGFDEDCGFFDTEEPQRNMFPPLHLASDYKQIFAHLKLGVEDYVRKNGFKTVVVGSSGGIDSALTLAIACEALGSDNVIAITMPSKVSSLGSVSDSVTLCKNLGVKLYNRPIAEEVNLSIENFKKAFGTEPNRLTIENEQARIRGRILMEYSNNFGALVLSTGNKSEMSVGYATIYGDMAGGIAVIADVYKMEVFAVSKWYNQYKHNEIIPTTIIDKEPSAELWEAQKDTDSLPPYPLLDAVLHLYLERDLLSDREIVEYTKQCEALTIGDIKKILTLTDRAEFKRRQAAPVLRIHRRSFGFGRNLPITQKFEVDYQNIL